MTVQAKFYVGSIESGDVGTSQASQVHLNAVCRGAENRGWASYTPAGSISMTIRNEAAVAQFEQGAEYLVTFTKVVPPQPHDGHVPNPMPTAYRPDGSHPELGEDPEADRHIMCADCGVMAKRLDTGELDWSAHDEHYGLPEGVERAV